MSVCFTPSLHDALPIWVANFHMQTVYNFVELMAASGKRNPQEILRKDVFSRVSQQEVRSMEDLYPSVAYGSFKRSEEHTSELQSRGQLVCRLLLEKKKS